MTVDIPTKTQTISPYYQNVIIRGAKRLNYNTQILLQIAGLPEVCTKRQSPEKATNLIRAVWQMMDDEFMGFTQQRCKQGVFAIMARQAIQCQTLREALIQGTHFYQTIRNDISLSFIEDSDTDNGTNNEAVLTLQLADESLDPDHFLIEFFLLIWHRFSIWLVGQKVPLKYASFKYPVPDHVKEYSLLLPCHCRFNQDKNSIVFDRNALSLPIKQKERELKRFLKNSPADLLSKPMFHSTFTTQVMNYMGEHQIERIPSIDQVAIYFNMSSRNLRRRLKKEGGSYQALKDTLRQTQAMKLLNDKELAINQIAREVGFNEPAGFTRAFKQWTGKSPKQYRDEGQSE
ncbi:MAG: AraC family transcriptional regulator [Alcanivorax sp.]|jgi:AraC-like DNA-binding protein|nr:MAG: AraC family transcriptional regulator [Oceanobacter sp.]|tara:strand:- start:6349 stop:7386 length:1038 start_codon:yes stop_codon:yes gene_type:complete